MTQYATSQNILKESAARIAELEHEVKVRDRALRLCCRGLVSSHHSSEANLYIKVARAEIDREEAK